MNEIDVPKVSVVIPVYNADDVLLDRALGSIFAQTEQSFEIVLVDDGSQNGCTQRIAAKFRNDCRLVIIRQENKGVEGARVNSTFCLLIRITILCCRIRTLSECR